MPWSLDRRTEGWCVIRESDGSVAGCHDTRADAIKQQRALYARESMTASRYDELDAQPDPPVDLHVDPSVLVAAVMERMSVRQSYTEQALVSALAAIGARDPVVNVHAPITVEPAVVNPTPITVEAPNVTVESPTVNSPDVHVNVQPAEVVLPERTKTMTFERDPLTREVNSVEVTET